MLLFACVHVCMCACVRACMRACVYARVCACVCVHVCARESVGVEVKWSMAQQQQAEQATTVLAEAQLQLLGKEIEHSHGNMDSSLVYPYRTTRLLALPV